MDTAVSDVRQTYYSTICNSCFVLSHRIYIRNWLCTTQLALYNNKHQHRVTRLVEAVVVVTRLAATQLAAAQHPVVAQLVLVAAIVINQIRGNATS